MRHVRPVMTCYERCDILCRIWVFMISNWQENTVFDAFTVGMCRNETVSSRFF